MRVSVNCRSLDRFEFGVLAVESGHGNIK